MEGSYPLNIDVTGPDKVARWRPIANYFILIPHIIFLYILNIALLVVTVLSWFAILFTGRQPESFGPFQVGVLRYTWRVVSYLFAWTEQYPPFAVPSGYADPGDFPAVLTAEPAPPPRNRLTTLFRGLLSIPQELAIFVIGIGAGVVLLLAWFAVLFTGRWPAGMKSFVMRYYRWFMRFQLFYHLVTDVYPPFGLQPA